MMVDRRWPTWKFLAMLGEEYSMITFFPFPESLRPYSGWPVGEFLVKSWIWVKTRLNRDGVRHVK
jgi:hypothetical protein